MKTVQNPSRPLINLLEQYLPSDLHEQECKKRMLTLIKEHEDCFKRSLETGHFTGSAWLLNQDETKALLTHHTKLNLWLQLGGHCDGDKDVLAVALKEAQEESGIEQIEAIDTTIFDIDIHSIPQFKQQKEHYHYDIRFLLRTINSDEYVQNHESKELRWISKDKKELPTKERSVTRMFDKWISR
jgi:8-oxo-dGTP pyrophosphatase MutT (NUDIX family)